MTSVLEPDSLDDLLEDRYSEAKVRGDDAQGKQARDIAKWEEDFKDTLTREPGLTHLASFPQILVITLPYTSGPIVPQHP